MATNREIVEQMFETINSQKRVRQAFERHLIENYIQHNPRWDVIQEILA